VLYIEDDQSNRRVMAVLFAREFPHLDLMVASRGGEGVTMATALQPRVILLDGQLPDMTGVAVVEALSADAVTREIPIVIVSGRPASGRLEASVAAQLLKPLDVAELCRVVRDLVNDIDES
jgi:CheY-like chemotaxis protein